MFWPLLACLRDYCANCSLAGISYIANNKLHISERVFWLFCFILSAFGSYKLISTFERDFEQSAVSIVFESLTPYDKIYFPSVAVCETLEKDGTTPAVEQYIESLKSLFSKLSYPEEYDYDVEIYVLKLLFPHEYNTGNARAHCFDKEGTDAECPHTHYRELTEKLHENCSNVLVECSLGHKAFNCCHYFVPLLTPYGYCYLLNSRQNNHPDSKHWFPSEVEDNHATVRLVTDVAVEVFVLNEEDIPYANLAGITTKVATPGKHTDLQISVQEMVNDVDVREVSPEYRGCRFFDEIMPKSSFRVYSFSACIVDCIAALQMRYCNCSIYNLMPSARADMPDCDYNGLLCLEKETKVSPDIKLLLPWPENNETCDCLPSCTEHDLRAVSEYSPSGRKGVERRSVAISLVDRPTERYRRQALRTRLDVVVTIGGILGLFLGASILSLIELVYYFTLRLYNNIQMIRKNERALNRVVQKSRIKGASLNKGRK
ncbi:pickpocket protein 19 [Bactrocera dorsalis]|uniref:Pickpocket protein 19 n=1 Tax=Bactrocera dorsalis TaxID=27457 RepID=A0ABM3J1D6_BACDO|nr:pickpocket protein 19 [Bactrocera dorsalis]